MYPETLILLGAALGLAVVNVAMRIAQTAWWRHQWAMRPSRRRRVRRATREALAYADSRPLVSAPAVNPEHGRHRARGRMSDVAPRHPAPQARHQEEIAA